MENGRTDRWKPLPWVASSRKDFRDFPEDVQDEAGYDLWLVQQGTLPSSAAVYVLHAFQKKSKQGIRTPTKELDLVKSRLRVAGQDYKQRYSDGT